MMTIRTFDVMTLKKTTHCDFLLKKIAEKQRQSELRRCGLDKRYKKLEAKVPLLKDKLRFVEEKIEKFLPLIETIPEGQQKTNLLLIMEKLQIEKRNLVKQNEQFGGLALFRVSLKLEIENIRIKVAQDLIAQFEARKLELISQGLF
jgi:hypothetical protein